MSSLGQILRRLLGSRIALFRAAGPAPPRPAARPLDVDDIDAGLRYALRGEVAGATPRADAWQRLQRRIEQEGRPAPLLDLPARPVALPVTGWSWTLLTQILPRVAQFGVAVLLLLVTAGGVATADRVAGLGRAPAVLNPVLDGLTARTGQVALRAQQVADAAPVASAIVAVTTAPVPPGPTRAGRGPDGLPVPSSTRAGGVNHEELAPPSAAPPPAPPRPPVQPQ